MTEFTELHCRVIWSVADLSMGKPGHLPWHQNWSLNRFMIMIALQILKMTGRQFELVWSQSSSKTKVHLQPVAYCNKWSPLSTSMQKWRNLMNSSCWWHTLCTHILLCPGINFGPDTPLDLILSTYQLGAVLSPIALYLAVEHHASKWPRQPTCG